MKKILTFLEKLMEKNIFRQKTHIKNLDQMLRFGSDFDINDQLFYELCFQNLYENRLKISLHNSVT